MMILSQDINKHSLIILWAVTESNIKNRLQTEAYLGLLKQDIALACLFGFCLVRSKNPGWFQCPRQIVENLVI